MRSRYYLEDDRIHRLDSERSIRGYLRDNRRYIIQPIEDDKWSMRQRFLVSWEGVLGAFGLCKALEIAASGDYEKAIMVGAGAVGVSITAITHGKRKHI